MRRVLAVGLVLAVLSVPLTARPAGIGAGIGVGIGTSIGRNVAPTGAAVSGFILMGSGDFILMGTGDKMILGGF